MVVFRPGLTEGILINRFGVFKTVGRLDVEYRLVRASRCCEKTPKKPQEPNIFVFKTNSILRTSPAILNSTCLRTSSR